jgi:hypothetical protein
MRTAVTNTASLKFCDRAIYNEYPIVRENVLTVLVRKTKKDAHGKKLYK